MVKKAQAGPIGFVFLLIVFLILWAIWIGDWLVEVGQTAIAEAELTGFEAFIYAYLNVWVLIGVVLGTMAYMYFAGGSY